MFQSRSSSLITSFWFYLHLIAALQAESSILQRDISIESFDFKEQDRNIDKYNYKYVPNITNIYTIEDTDPDYPYEQLLKVVRETKQILNSRNNTMKEEMLNLDPSFYQNYLNGDFSDSPLDFPTTPEIPVLAGSQLNKFDCPIEVKRFLPQKWKNVYGKEYYILNIGSELTQKVNLVTCRQRGDTCGDKTTWELNYVYRCEQSYERIKKLLSVPIDNIGVSQQEVNDFPVPDNCICKRMRV